VQSTEPNPHSTVDSEPVTFSCHNFSIIYITFCSPQLSITPHKPLLHRLVEGVRERVGVEVEVEVDEPVSHNHSHSHSHILCLSLSVSLSLCPSISRSLRLIPMLG
jgi:hypothetical protein